MFDFIFKRISSGIYPMDKQVNSVCDVICSYEDWKISQNNFYVYLENSVYKISFWNANKWYGWGTEGTLISKIDNVEMVNWQQSMPSMYHQKKLRKHLNMLLQKKFEYLLSNATND